MVHYKGQKTLCFSCSREKGQKTLCFSCSKEGHTSAVCPSKIAARVPSSNSVARDPVNVGASTAMADLWVSESQAFVAEVSVQLACQTAITIPSLSIPSVSSSMDVASHFASTSEIPGHLIATSVPTESGITSSAMSVRASSSSLASCTGTSLAATCTVNSIAGPIFFHFGGNWFQRLCS